MKKLSIYIHVPFCSAKCGYCSFYSVSDTCFMQKYVEALIKDITNKSEELKEKNIISIYFGGGTPSLLSKENISDILSAIYKNYNVLKTAEITIEVNPDSLTKDKLLAYKNSGINRISIGVQSFNDDELKMLSRLHSSQKAIKAVYMVKECGFQNISIDLIYNLPNSNLKTLSKSLEMALSLDVEHISLYSLKLDEDCVMAKKELELPSEDEELEQYLYLCNTLEINGFSHYEISNFAKPGFYSQHNSVYWQGGDYIGFGASAHSYLSKKRFYMENSIEKYIKNPVKIYEEISSITPAQEYVMLAIRHIDGISLKRCKKIFSKNEYEKLIISANEIEKLQLGNTKNDKFVLNNKGMYLSNAIIAKLVFH